MKIILGTAHGSNTLGKCSPDGKLREYLWSREMCVMVKEELVKNGVDCVIDLLDDYEKSLSSRVKIVNDIVRESDDDCVYISIHLNAAGNDGKWHDARGWTVWVYNKCSIKSKELALSLFNVAKEKELLGNRYIPKEKYFTRNFCVLRETICPAILTENLFQDNEEDVKFLMSEEGKKEICDLHVRGIMNYIENH